MKTVLFAWEHGGGFGHIVNLGRFAALLKHHEIRPVFVLKHPQAAHLLGTDAEILQAPPWPVKTSDENSFRSTATMHDQLASAGLANEQDLRSMLQAWDDLLKTIAPDLVVADSAPAASMMSHGRNPLIVVGNGYTAPPGDMKRFPPLHRVHPPRWSEDETLGTVNRVLRSLGRPPLERLPQVFSGDAQVVLTFPLLDPYDLQRSGPLAGPIFDSPPLEGRKDADNIFVYLSRGVLSKLPFDIVPALLPIASRLIISAPDIASGMSDDLMRRGARISSQHLPLSETLASARLVIHFGGGGLAAHAVAAGVPQLVLATHIEQLLNGLQLEKARIGKVIDSFEPQVDISTALDAILADDGMRQRAAQAGHEHRDMLTSMKPLETFEAAALKLLGK
ncbi:MAG: nucleotide disphospho-sugar-binding domain-containing protein [Pseudomonadota bacterium]